MLKLMDFVASNVLRKCILNIKDEPREQRVDRQLRRGDELCRGRMTPMGRDLAEKVRDIYKKCKSSKGDTPLMLALDMGLMDMAWGFIQCAKQTNTNLHTGETGNENVQEFFWRINEENVAAFDIAFKNGHEEVARQLLSNAPESCLTSQWYLKREALPRLLNHDHQFDRFIFDMMEKETNQNRTSTSTTSGQINGQRGTR